MSSRMRTIEILESILKYVLYHGKMDKKKKQYNSDLVFSR